MATPLDSSSSASIRPTRRVGFRALMAYWGMIETSLKRKPFIRSGSAMGSSLPSSSTVPPTWRMRPSRRIRLLPRVDLPQPDSPARPTSSPSATPKLTPSRAWTWPRRVRYPTLSVTGSQLPQLGVEDLVQADVHDVERAHDQGDPKARGHEPPPHAQRQGAPQDGVVHHQAQRDALGRAQADEVDGGRGQQRPPEQQDEGHEQVRAHVGGDLGDHDPGPADAAEPGQV